MNSDGPNNCIVFRGRRASIGTRHCGPSYDIAHYQVRDQYNEDSYGSAVASYPSIQDASDVFTQFDDTSQTWIWDDIFGAMDR